MFALMFLFALLDIQQPRVPDEGIVMQFTLSDLESETTIDCSENPQGGGLADQPLTMTHPQNDADSTPSPTLLSAGLQQSDPTAVQSTTFVSPGRAPNPNPDPEPTPPVVVTPEHDTLAILSLTGIMLIAVWSYHRWRRSLAWRL